MALERSHEDQAGIINGLAYWRIIATHSNVERKECELYVWVYRDATTRTLTPETTIAQLVYTVKEPHWTTYFAIAAQNVLNQNHINAGYQYFKTLSKFSAARDV